MNRQQRAINKLTRYMMRTSSEETNLHTYKIAKKYVMLGLQKRTNEREKWFIKIGIWKK